MPRWIITVPLAAAWILVAPWGALAQDDEEEADRPAETSEPEAPAQPPGPATTTVPGPGEAGSMSWEQAWDTGFALYREGRHDQAIPYLERALAIEADDPTVRAYLAECYRRTGDEARAAALLPQEPVATEGDDSDDGDRSDGSDDDGDCDGDCDEDCDGDCDEDCDEDCDGDCDGRGSCDSDDDHHPMHMFRSTRRGKHLGFGVELLNNAVSVGLYVEVLPVHFLSVQGGIGAGDLHTRFWWVQAGVAPIDGPLSPTIGIGVSGNFGLNFHFGDVLIPGFGDYYLSRINPYAHAGVLLVTRRGFAGAFEISAVVTGDPTFPVAPRAGFRLGLLL